MAVSRAYIFRSRSCFLSSSPSSFLMQQPVFYLSPRRLVPCLSLALSLYGLVILSFYLPSIVCFLLIHLVDFVLSPALSYPPPCPITRLIPSSALSCHPPCPVIRLVLSPSLSFLRSSCPLAYYLSCLLLSSCLLYLLFNYITPSVLRPFLCNLSVAIVSPVTLIPNLDPMTSTS